MMTFRFQRGAAQFVWLADTADPDLWKALDNMTRCRQLAFVFREEGNLWFFSWNIPSTLGQFGIYRRDIGGDNVNFLTAAGGAIADGSIATHFSSVFPSVEVKYRCINILMTAHLKRVLDSIPGSATVSPGSAAASGLQGSSRRQAWCNVRDAMFGSSGESIRTKFAGIPDREFSGIPEATSHMPPHALIRTVHAARVSDRLRFGKVWYSWGSAARPGANHGVGDIRFRAG
jgi:hypothetical protein